MEWINIKNQAVYNGNEYSMCNCLFSVILVLILVFTDFTLSDELEKGLSVLQVNLLRILNLS